MDADISLGRPGYESNIDKSLGMSLACLQIKAWGGLGMSLPCLPADKSLGRPEYESTMPGACR